MLKNINEKMSSLESQVKHQVLSHMILELHELREINAKLSKEVLTLRSRQACSEPTINNITDNNSIGGLGGNSAPNLQTPLNSLSSPLLHLQCPSYFLR